MRNLTLSIFAGLAALLALPDASYANGGLALLGRGHGQALVFRQQVVAVRQRVIVQRQVVRQQVVVQRFIAAPVVSHFSAFSLAYAAPAALYAPQPYYVAPAALYAPPAAYTAPQAYSAPQAIQQDCCQEIIARLDALNAKIDALVAAQRLTAPKP